MPNIKVLIDVPLVHRLIAKQFPQWAGLSIKPVAVGGWDNRTFHLGEQMLELNYGAQVTPWLLVRPDMQYYIEPGAFIGKKRGNALAVGLQIKATF